MIPGKACLGLDAYLMNPLCDALELGTYRPLVHYTIEVPVPKHIETPKLYSLIAPRILPSSPVVPLWAVLLAPSDVRPQHTRPSRGFQLTLFTLGTPVSSLFLYY